MILTDYRCGCTWVGKRSKCVEYCGKHGEPRRLIRRIPTCPKNAQGWDWQLKKDGAKGIASVIFHKPCYASLWRRCASSSSFSTWRECDTGPPAVTILRSWSVIAGASTQPASRGIWPPVSNGPERARPLSVRSRRVLERRHYRMNSIGEAALSKVPQVTLGFWIIKLAATTLGETGGDALSMTINLGYVVSSAIFFAFFIVTVAVRSPRDHSIRFSIWPSLWPPLRSARRWRITRIALSGSAMSEVRCPFSRF